MSGNRSSAWTWLTAVILVHLLVSFAHGAAHAQAHVPLSRAANLFVYIVILAGPLIGLAIVLPGLKTRPTSERQRIGSWLIVVTMSGSLIFGLVNHFVLSSPDHVTHVDPEWRVLFGATAVLLAVTEALGSGLAFRLAQERKLS
jgi:MFS family permease